MTKQTANFDAEIEKVFQLMIHSLYEHKDIFLRELISNASDACDKRRYQAVQGGAKEPSRFTITITPNKDAGTLSISDNGIGMDGEAMAQALGTIAHSGTQRFLDVMSGDAKRDSQLIGQFGVGFYSAFMVASRVTVRSKSALDEGGSAYIWESEGKSTYSIEELPDTSAVEPGTQVTLHMREDCAEFLDPFRLRHIIETYSSHIAFDIILAPDPSAKEDAQAEEAEEIINDGTALWLKSKSEISEQEYEEFFHQIGYYSSGKPFLTLHQKAEGAVSYSCLMFIPDMPPFDLFHPERKSQVKLYINRVFIADEGVELLPSYLRFIRGVIDSEDLPLNISRETVQNSAVLHKIRTAITKKLLSEIKRKGDAEGEDAQQEYLKFWENFGAVIKEGLCDGTSPRDEILEVCRFNTLRGDAPISIAQYKDAMGEEQKEIYFITGDKVGIEDSPQLEGFKERGLDVLLLSDSVDSFWVNVLHEYQGIPLVPVTRAKLDIKQEESTTQQDDDSGAQTLIARMKEVLGDAVADVCESTRLTKSPVCLTVPEGAPDMRMERIMMENKQLAQKSQKVLEVNISHPVIATLARDIEDVSKAQSVEDRIHLLHAQAAIIEGQTPEDITAFSTRMNRLMEQVA